MIARRSRETPVSGRAEREAVRAKVKQDIQEKTEKIIVKENGHNKNKMKLNRK